MIRRLAQIVGLLLCGLGAEVLAAEGEGTGDPAGVLVEIIFFGVLYGAPALVVRELVRRVGGGRACC
ncbi:MAG: hypothetical protein QM607_01960 [Microbacterium sp.]